MKTKNFLYPLIILFASLLFIYSCEEEEFITGSSAKLSFSTDTVTFDTVFSTIGSTTKRFTVKNPHDKWIKISSIELAGRESSDYRLNINGVQTNEMRNIELRPDDSLYIFVEVTIDPNDANNPLVNKDSVVFTTSNNIQDVKLISWGQDVHLIDGELLQSRTWSADKPYLIYNSALLDTGQTLEIQPGANIHFHKNSGLYIAGTIIAEGSAEEPIIFQGDRLEDDYEHIPGQWNGIRLLPGSKENRFNYTEIKNGIFGIWVDTLASTTTPTLTISNTKIQHMTSIGLWARGSTVEASNCLITDCGDYAVALTLGGEYEFYHTTIGNYWSSSTRTTPSLLLNNYYIDENGNTQQRPLEKALFVNSIIYGNQTSEIGFDFESVASFNYTFDHCLIKIDPETETNPDHYKSIIKNKNPKFVNPYRPGFNYQLDTLSPAIGAAKQQAAEMYPFDLLNKSRIADEAPDLGAYERIPGSGDDE